MTIPVSHLEHANRLEAPQPYDFWEITLRSTPTRFYLHYGHSVTWRSQLYDALAITMSGEGDYADDEVARPTLTIINPDKIFGPFASAGHFDLATIVRKRVLPIHVQQNANIFRQRVWISGRVSSVSSQTIVLELRSPHDFPNFEVPPRMFMPPEFPYVAY